MGRPPKGSRPTVDSRLTPEFWQGLTGTPEPTQRDQFLWLSIDLVRELGLSQFTITSVARQLGYSVAMVNHHFGSRDGLIAEGAAAVHTVYSENIVAATERAPENPRDRLEASIRSRIGLGRSLGGWAQVLNFPFHSFESRQIAMERAGRSFEESFYRNLAYLTRLVFDYQTGVVANPAIDVSDFPASVAAKHKDAFYHAVMIGTATAGAVMWLAGRLDIREQPSEISEITESMIEWQVNHLIDSIPTGVRA
jgi:hypothetical protein